LLGHLGQNCVLVLRCENKTAICRGLLERMKGLEPSTFCMAIRLGLVMLSENPCNSAILGSLSSG